MAEEFRTRLKAEVKDYITEVRTLITHPMETGARKELETGRLVPVHFIKNVKCEHNGKVVMSAIWSVGISINPYCVFQFKGGAKGDTVKLSWEDNKGNTKTVETKIKEK